VTELVHMYRVGVETGKREGEGEGEGEKPVEVEANVEVVFWI